MAQLQNLHALPIVLAAVVAWFFGAAYYSLLCRKWLAAQGKTMEQSKAENADKSTAAKVAPFILSFVAEIGMAAVLSGILFHIGIYTVRAGAFSGFMCWLGFVLTTVVVNNAYTFRKVALTAIDTGHWLGVLLIIGAVLGGFGS
jgi:glycerol uptake facilitator-like aquaporin